MYAVGLNEAPRLPARVRVNGASDAVLWLDAARAARPLPSPATTPTVTEGAAGDLTGAYRWLVAFGSAVMVSYPSPVSALLTVTAKRVNLSVVPTSTDGRVTKRRIYRTVAGGSVYKLVGEIADNVTTDFEDNVADGALTDEYLAVTVFADGNATDEWAERGRYGNHATQGTAGNRPLFKVGILNGRPVVRFDGTSDYLVCGSSTSFKQVLVVARWNGALFTDYNGLLSGTGAADSEVVLLGVINSTVFYDDGGQATVYHKDGVAHDETLMLGPINTFAIMSISSAAGWTVTPQIGWDRVYGGRFWNNDVAAAVAYNRVLPDSERKRLERYYSRLTGIAVA